MLIKLCRNVLIAGAVGVLMPAMTAARADGGDSSADAGRAFAQTVARSRGILVKVPKDAQKRENTDAAEIRVYEGAAPVDRSTNLTQVWSAGVDAGAQPVVTNQDVSRDSSTCGWYGGNYGYGGSGYGRGYGWQTNYYNSWTPSYYGGYGSYYNFGSPYRYDNDDYYSYYYYPRW